MNFFKRACRHQHQSIVEHFDLQGHGRYVQRSSSKVAASGSQHVCNVPLPKAILNFALHHKLSPKMVSLKMLKDSPGPRIRSQGFPRGPMQKPQT